MQPTTGRGRANRITATPPGGSAATELGRDVAERGLSQRALSADLRAIARDLHDGIAQELWLAKLATHALEQHPSLDDEARRLCGEIRRSVDASLTDAHLIIGAIRGPAPTKSVDLKAEIERQIANFSRRSGVRAEARIDPTAGVPAAESKQILGILQEALTNIRKHARAGRIRVALRDDPSSIVLSVSDDGIGFDPTLLSPGYGRESMAARAAAIGGRLALRSSVGRGTTVTVRVPTRTRRT